ncbi:hypothetical protein DTO027B5_5223 [Paecilomyces variotii]|nr:hypothetical protein DTO032I3_1105 [Paecilomyces variotii]KAJ9275602.1 hypothetical protein DTO021D3_7540 [Paecilomyces variotii]KAJ9326172.1 hypothetical protein DTO027B3_2819 [Paecilomyces variotii]KAJ9332970.1 hypothetical protein DTO027B5_5223 [Paecilomyces variotii]KAJ9342660.1 hypothetical protein DTO027B6_4779 [Paecilomyces variotii]
MQYRFAPSGPVSSSICHLDETAANPSHRSGFCTTFSTSGLLISSQVKYFQGGRMLGRKCLYDTDNRKICSAIMASIYKNHFS